jgi:hypothetical protein
MLLAVRDYLLPNVELTKDLPEFSANFGAFQNTINEIQKIAELQKFDKTGLAKEKEQLRELLTMLVSENSLKLSAYAKLSNNIGLASEVKFTKSQLRKSPDTAVKDYAQIVYDKAEANLSALGSYGITQETQSVLLNAINAYNSSLSKPRLGLTEKSQATKQLAVLFQGADKLIGKLDAVINIIKMGKPEFYNSYRSARKVVETGTRSLILKASAIELPGGIPLKGATFTFVPDGGMKVAELGAGGGSTEIVKKTAEKGSFNVRNMPEGTYRVRVSKTGYKDKEVTVSVVPGEMAELRVELEKV